MTEQELISKLVEMEEILRNKYYGKYRGIVRELGTEDRLSEIKVEIPEVYGVNQTSPWVKAVLPFAGPGYGTLFLPSEGDGVWVEFEAGDISRPIWVGFWWSSQDEIPEPSALTARVTVTPNGHKIILDDENDEIQVIHSNGPLLKLTGEEITIQNDSASIVITGSEVNINNGALVVSS